MQQIRDLLSDGYSRVICETELPVAVFFWSPACKESDAMAPVFEKVAGDCEGRVDFFRCDAQYFQGLAINFEVPDTPTIALFVDGDKVEELVGSVSAEEIASLFDRHLQGSPSGSDEAALLGLRIASACLFLPLILLVIVAGNIFGDLLSDEAAMMLRYSLGLEAEADAVDSVLSAGYYN